MSEMNYGINTRCVQAGYRPGNGEPRQIPIIQSTTFKYDTSEDMGKLFDLEAAGYFYTRLQNPTNDYVAAKIAALEGGTAGMLTSSGQAANFFSLFNLCECGDHIVSSSSHTSICGMPASLNFTTSPDSDTDGTPPFKAGALAEQVFALDFPFTVFMLRIIPYYLPT